MKITRRQLKRFIREEKRKLTEAPQDRIVQEANLLGDLNSIASSIEEVEKGMYGLQDPGDPDQGAGDELAMDLNLQIERLNEFFRKLNAYFESTDPENKAQEYWESQK
jgi:hypothetical protein